MARNDVFVWAEADVSSRLGLSRDVAKKFRREGLESGKDFMMKPGKGIFYSEEGFKALLAACGALGGVMTDEVENTPCAKDTSGGAGGVRHGIVCRIFLRRTKLLQVRFDDGARAMVRVRNNRKFVIQQRIPLRPFGESSPLFRLACREPMRRGKLSDDFVNGGEA